MRHFRIAIIGAGPAGMSCAIQLKRMGLDPVVFERPEPASMLRMANRVENYLGFPDGIRGEELYRIFMKQFERFEIGLIYKEVTRLSLSGGIFFIETDDESFSSDIVVVSSGTRPMSLSIPIWNDKLSHYLHTDISRIPRQGSLAIGIIGLGDAAFDYALNLAGQGHQVAIFGRSQRIMANKALLEQFRRRGGIPLNLGHVLVSVEESTQGIRCRFRSGEEMADHVLDFLIFATGREADLGYLDEAILENLTSLNQEGRIYLAGDVKNGDFRQTAIAAGDGIRTAMEIAMNESNTEN